MGGDDDGGEEDEDNEGDILHGHPTDVLSDIEMKEGEDEEEEEAEPAMIVECWSVMHSSFDKLFLSVFAVDRKFKCPETF